jgi:hypothetical protein
MIGVSLPRSAAAWSIRAMAGPSSVTPSATNPKSVAFKVAGVESFKVVGVVSGWQPVLLMEMIVPKSAKSALREVFLLVEEV